MPLPSDSSPSLGGVSDTEMEMRRALGLDGDSATPHRPNHAPRPAERHTHASDGHKRRFVQDGEVPVFVVQGRRAVGTPAAEPRLATSASPVNRLEIAETALKAEREARERTERSLHEAQATIHDLQTALGHAALARDEAAGALRRAESDRLAAEATLAEERLTREQAEEKLALLSARTQAPVGRPRGRKPAVAAVAEQLDLVPVPAPVPKKRGRPRLIRPEVEPKPVRWWLPTKAAKKPRKTG